MGHRKNNKDNGLTSSQSKKMIRQAKRVERMKAFANQSDMQNLFHANDPDKNSNHAIEHNSPYAYFSKEKYVNKTGDPSLILRNGIEDIINGAIVDNCINENEPRDNIVNENLAIQVVDSKGHLCSENKELDIKESQSEDSEEDNDLWNTIMRKK